MGFTAGFLTMFVVVQADTDNKSLLVTQLRERDINRWFDV